MYTFDCGGIKICDQLIDTQTALEACEKVRNHPLLTFMKEMVCQYKLYEEGYKETSMLLTLMRRIAELIDPDSFPGDNEARRREDKD